MIEKKQLRSLIKSVIADMGFNSANAVKLIVETINVESLRQRYIRQVGVPVHTGAFGYIQMEIATAKDIYKNYISYRPSLLEVYNKYRNESISLELQLKCDLAFQIFMCRCHYLRVPAPIPDTLQERARYWKIFYNTEDGKGTTEHYMKLNR